MDKREKTDNRGKSRETSCSFPFMDFKGISEMMAKCCEDLNWTPVCCSMTEREPEEKDAEQK